ncbi:crooked neck-like protein [Acrasis kona]|uniref:Crooked neck-like protein n=1 Tax=Acrasis kona TaxID=1008807 RepID=A0AAW2ZHE2_9EUKA
MSGKPQPINFERLAQQSEKANASTRQPGRPSGTSRVKSKQPAQAQITAEQILREAIDRQDTDNIKPPEQEIADLEELEDYRGRQRKTFEDAIRRSKFNMAHYVKYAQWEESQKQFDRVRSIYERGLDVDYRNVNLWLRFAETEMRNKFINHARNVWDRAVSFLPRIDQLWYKYAHMEELMGSTQNARNIFERWMEWQPDEKAYKSYIKFELRYQEYDNARNILRRFIKVHPSVNSWVYFAEFEQSQGNIEGARQVYTDAIDDLFGQDEATHFGEEAQDLYVKFAKFEESQREIERARIIYKYALDHIPKQFASQVYASLMAFEKQFGDKEGIEQVVLGKKRFEYEQEIKNNPYNYDVYFSYAQLEQQDLKDFTRVREVFERAIAQVPPLCEKRLYRRYIYLWIHYALFEELTAKDYERTRQVYKACLEVIPHSKFSFSKIWILACRFEMRMKNLTSARKIFGNALGMCAKKTKIFREYIRMEIMLGNVDRARTLFEKQLECDPSNAIAWRTFAELESKLNETQRARSVFELAIQQPVMDMPELIWKSFIDFEISHSNLDGARKLYDLLLSKTQHVKVWSSYAQFEHSIAKNTELARAVYKRAHDHYKQNTTAKGTLEGDAVMQQDGVDDDQALRDLKEQRSQLLDEWFEFENQIAKSDQETISNVKALLPDKIRKVRRIMAPDGTATAGKEEYIDYVFPDEKNTQKSNFEILNRAHMWKQAMMKNKNN